MGVFSRCDNVLDIIVTTNSGKRMGLEEEARRDKSCRRWSLTWVINMKLNQNSNNPNMVT